MFYVVLGASSESTESAWRILILSIFLSLCSGSTVPDCLDLWWDLLLCARRHAFHTGGFGSTGAWNGGVAGNGSPATRRWENSGRTT